MLYWSRKFPEELIPSLTDGRRSPGAGEPGEPGRGSGEGAELDSFANDSHRVPGSRHGNEALGSSAQIKTLFTEGRRGPVLRNLWGFLRPPFLPTSPAPLWPAHVFFLPHDCAGTRMPVLWGAACSPVTASGEACQLPSWRPLP